MSQKVTTGVRPTLRIADKNQTRQLSRSVSITLWISQKST